jgi:hydroxypyruvate isomerase
MLFDVNISILFQELPLEERPAAAAGLNTVELWWSLPTPTPADKELNSIAKPIRDAGFP